MISSTIASLESDPIHVIPRPNEVILLMMNTDPHWTSYTKAQLKELITVLQEAYEHLPFPTYVGGSGGAGPTGGADSGGVPTGGGGPGVAVRK